MQSIAQLLQAAEFLDRREREAEHGYASTLPMPEEYSKKRTRGKKSQGSRSTHNELEKNRRAHLRHCLEKLKDLVPVGAEASRHTTLGLLTKARGFIKNLEDREKRHNQCKDQLRREQRYLRRKLEQLSAGSYRPRQERSISECSTSTNSSTSSAGSVASSRSSEESDEIDIVGGFGSDSDDHSSVESLGSDGYGGQNHRSYSFSMDDSPYSEDLWCQVAAAVTHPRTQSSSPFSSLASAASQTEKCGGQHNSHDRSAMVDLSTYLLLPTRQIHLRWHEEIHRRVYRVNRELFCCCWPREVIQIRFDVHCMYVFFWLYLCPL